MVVVLFVLLIIIPAVIFCILQLIDCCTRKFENRIEQLIWILVLLVTNIAGAFIYYFLVRKSNPQGLVGKEGKLK